MLLNDRVALVTGASRGIGASTARILAQRGARVAVSACTVSDLEAVAASIQKNGGEALAVPCDVVNPSQVGAMIEAVMKKWGRLDILVNNAGLGTPVKPVEEVSPEEWDENILLNLKSVFLCIRAAAPIMKRQKYGRIVMTIFLPGPYPISSLSVPLGFPLEKPLPRRPTGLFHRFFKRFQVIPHYSREDIFPLIIEVRIEEFRLALEYATYNYRRLDPLLTV